MQMLHGFLSLSQSLLSCGQLLQVAWPVAKLQAGEI